MMLAANCCETVQRRQSDQATHGVRVAADLIQVSIGSIVAKFLWSAAAKSPRSRDD
jgi:hypothetical protein